MNIQDILYYVFWAGLFIVMMRFGCGAHIMGHRHQHATVVPDNASGVDIPAPVPGRMTDPVCGMNVQTSAAETAAYRGHIHYFCSQKCREKFEAAPDSYAKSARGTPLKKENHHGC